MADYGTVTLLERRHTSVKRVEFDWLSVNGGGDAGKAGKTSALTYDGVLERVVFIPGSATPSDHYNVTVTDSDSADVLAGLGLSLSNASTVTKTHEDGLGAVAGSTLSLNVTSAGNAKTGTVIIYLR